MPGCTCALGGPAAHTRVQARALRRFAVSLFDSRATLMERCQCTILCYVPYCAILLYHTIVLYYSYTATILPPHYPPPQTAQYARENLLKNIATHHAYTSGVPRYHTPL